MVSLHFGFWQSQETIETVVAIDHTQRAEDLDEPPKAASAIYAEFDKITPDAVPLQQVRHLGPNHVALKLPYRTLDRL
jgi:hypothetical protein